MRFSCHAPDDDFGPLRESHRPQPFGMALAEVEATLMTSLYSFPEGQPVLRFAILFLVIALVAALFGFGLVAGMAYDAAKILFFVFLVLCVLSFLGHGF